MVEKGQGPLETLEEPLYVSFPLGIMTHPHPLLAAGVPATPQKSQPLPLTTRNFCEEKPYCLLKPRIKIFLLLFPT